MTFPNFVAGDILRAQDMNAVAGWKVASGTLSLSTTPTNVTGVFSSEYKNYRLLLNCTFKSGSIRVDMKYIVGTTATSSAYYQAGIGSDYGANATLYYQRSANDAQFFGIASSALLTQSYDIYNPNRAFATTHHGTVVDVNNGYPYMVGGSQLSTTQFTGFQLFTSAGTATVEYQVIGYTN
jgi:hypothetical protein